MLCLKQTSPKPLRLSEGTITLGSQPLAQPVATQLHGEYFLEQQKQGHSITHAGHRVMLHFRIKQ